MEKRGAPEQEDKKKEFLEIKRQSKKNPDGPPAYLLVMLVVLGVLIGIAAMMALDKDLVRIFQPATPPLGQVDQNMPITNDTAYRNVSVTMLYSSECKKCRQTNTVEELFKVRQIPYTLTSVDVNSEEGKNIAQKFEITMVPTAIVGEENMAFYPTTKAQFDQVSKQGSKGFKRMDRAYVIAEENLDDKAFYPTFFLEKAPGYCDSGKPTVVQFDDFYAGPSTKNRRQLYNFLQDFNTSADVKFSYVQTAYSADDNSINGNIFLMCASKQGKYIEFEHAMAGIYCNNPFKGDPTMLTDVEIDGCWTLSDHYGKPLSQFELDVAAKRANLDLNKLKDCFAGAQLVYKQAASAVKGLDVRRAGTFIVDCRETASIEGLQATYCAYHPKEAACSKPADT